MKTKRDRKNLFLINKNFLVLVLLLLFPSISYANNLADGCNNEISSQEKNEYLWRVNLTGIGIISTWGIINWDYFTTSPNAASEGWFENNTKSGGADKIGHLYTSYLTTHGLSNLFESWCINKNDAAIYGAVSSFALSAYMEIGDSFSGFGYSNEDMLANTVGIIYGYFSYKNPQLANILDIRWEYKPNPNTLEDLTTDYENSKYLLALKLNGFDFSHNNFLKHVELHVGYYSRGFSDLNVTKQRSLFVGISFNLTDLFRRHSYNKTATFFKYYQIPYLSIQSNNF